MGCAAKTRASSATPGTCSSISGLCRSSPASRAAGHTRRARRRRTWSASWRCVPRRSRRSAGRAAVRPARSGPVPARRPRRHLLAVRGAEARGGSGGGRRGAPRDPRGACRLRGRAAVPSHGRPRVDHRQPRAVRRRRARARARPAPAGRPRAGAARRLPISRTACRGRSGTTSRRRAAARASSTSRRSPSRRGCATTTRPASRSRRTAITMRACSRSASRSMRPGSTPRS